MANHLIEDYIESIINPDGRFRTIGRLCAENDSRGCPVFRMGSHTIVFNVLCDGRRCMLTITTNHTPEECHTMAQRAVDTQLGIPYLAECLYLPDEMVVYDQNGQAERFDVILQPANDNIADFVRKNSARSQLKYIRKALESVACAAEVFDRKGIVHGSMAIRNMCLDENVNLSVADYPLSLSGCKVDDSRALLTAGVMLYLAGSEPQVYRAMGVHGIFSDSRSSLNRRHVVSVAEFYGMETIALAIKQLDLDLSREMVYKRLAKLAAEPFRPMPLLCRIVGEMSDQTTAFSELQREPPVEDHTLNVNFKECQVVATVQDTLVRYQKGGYWGYADRSGRKLHTAKPLTGAYDFYEGRAVVHTVEGYGLIDRNGRMVMEDRFDDMVWYGEANVVAACNQQGKWHLYNRCGEQISEVSCDAVCDCNEGVIVARQGSKYGYIATDGRRLTDFIYDEAYGFSNGTALVAIGRRRYHIDRNGHETTESIQNSKLKLA